MQTTISLKIPSELFSKLKKTSKVRGVSMSDLIRTSLDKIFTKSATVKQEEPEIFKYFGIFEEDDEQYNEFEKGIEQRKADYKSREVEL